MKRISRIISPLVFVLGFLGVMLPAETYAATYPYTQQSVLANSVNVTTVVTVVSGMQVARLQFLSAAGEFGEITLSPVQPMATNVQFQLGRQTLQLSNVSFRAQFGFESGQVTVSGSVTDPSGSNATAFSKQIAAWQ